jgi:hypothetical protein
MALTTKQIQDQYVELVAVVKTLPSIILAGPHMPELQAVCLAQWASMNMGNRLCMVAEYDLDPGQIINALWNDYQVDNSH